MHPTRGSVRHIGAAAAGAMALIYYLIGLGVLSIGGSADGEMVDLFAFGIGAGTAFLTIAVVLAFTDQRWLFALVLLFQIFVYAVYVGVAGDRQPPFEVWGITLRAIQLVVIGCLVYLVVKSPHGRHREVMP